MPRTYRSRIQFEQQGYTLMELLTVVLLIGILAVLALPVFLSMPAKGQDADAKSNARNMVSQLEACYVEDRAYTNCATSEDVVSSGLERGVAPGQVELSDLGEARYTIVGHSKSGHSFTIEKTGGSGLTHSCTPHGRGGCPDHGDW